MPAKTKNQKIAEIDGSWRKHPERKREVIPVDSNRPEPPQIVKDDDLALALWVETCDTVESMGLLCTQDKALLTAYVLNYRQYLASVKQLHKEGDTSVTRDGGIRASGGATNYQRYAQLHIKLMAELGLTPSARASLAAPASRSEDEDNPVGVLLKRLGA